MLRSNYVHDNSFSLFYCSVCFILLFSCVSSFIGIRAVTSLCIIIVDFLRRGFSYLLGFVTLLAS